MLLADLRPVTRLPPARLGPEKISVARLPITGSDVFGREEDIAFLDDAAPARVLTTSPGKYAGQDNGWVLALIEPVILDFDKSIMKYRTSGDSRAARVEALP
jgi:hypothetical protein